MAYLYRRPSGRVEIREAYTTDRGPRSKTLASFEGALRPEHLERAEARAARPLDRRALTARARTLGIPVRGVGADADARALLARIRRGARPDPRVVGLLLEALGRLPRTAVAEELAEVAEWIGASDVERGRALRDVLRLYGGVVAARPAVREPARRRFPRFHSRERPVAS